MQPVYFPESNPVSQKSEPKKQKTKILTGIQYSELKATGFSRYIGKSQADFTQAFGTPKRIDVTGLSYQWWIYGQDGQDYFQVAIENQKVVSVFVIGTQKPVEPFAIGMNLAQISTISTLYSNFSFEFKQKKYALELTEEDMNYRPLVAFDNQTFAILQMSKLSGKLLAVRYVSKEMLLQLQPYQLTQGATQSLTMNEKEDWETINDNSQTQLLTIVNILRARDKLPKYTHSNKFDTISSLLLGNFLLNTDSVITDELRQKELKEAEQHNNVSTPFMMSQVEMDQLLRKMIPSVSQRRIHGIYAVPSYDVPWLVMSWYGELVDQPQLLSKKDKDVGVAFSKGHVLFLITDDYQGQTIQRNEDNGSGEQ